MKKIIVFLLALAWGFTSVGCVKMPVKTSALEMASAEEENTCAKDEAIFVYVCGAVKTPGVYECLKDSRVYEVVNMAGGFLAQADIDAINQAEHVEDGEKIYIPYIDDVEGAGTNSTKININTATKEQLMTLSGVGESKADSIIAYRNKNGRFKKIDELMNIPGIKEGVFNKIAEEISVN